jgi:hypothetical protein
MYNSSSLAEVPVTSTKYWYKGTGMLGYGIRHPMYISSYQVPGASARAPGTRYLVPRSLSECVC